MSQRFPQELLTIILFFFQSNTHEKHFNIEKVHNSETVSYKITCCFKTCLKIELILKTLTNIWANFP